MEEKNTNFLKFRILPILTFILGAIIMYLLITNYKANYNKNVIKENVTTTTIEEVSDLKQAINKVYESTVYIEVSNDKVPTASGSGFVYKKNDDNAYILTNYHVIKNGNNYVVTFTNGEEVEATYVNGDEYYDVAILKVDSNSVNVVANLGDSSEVELGDTVFTVGSPIGKDYMGTITKGIISGINRMVSVKLTDGTYLMEVIQTDASINNGNSGGPICNIRGEVIGITSSKLIYTGVEGMGFAIPINSISSLLSSMEEGISIERPYLGIQLVNLTNTFALQYYYNIRISSNIEYGAVLSYVENNKSANKAGLQVGDVIVELDGKKIDDVSHFKYELYKHKLGDEITIKYYRGNKLNEVTIELTESIKSEQ